MKGTFAKVYIHIVFRVKGQRNLLPEKHHDELYKYITGTISNKKQKLMAINGTEDHIHILVSIAADTRISDLVRDIKANSSRFINQKLWLSHKFNWQEGFGVFSYNQSMVSIICNYIQRQKVHHRKRGFDDEYLEILRKYDCDIPPIK